MWFHRPFVLAALAAVVFGVLPASAVQLCPATDINVDALTYTGTGCFVNDTSVQSFFFTVDSTETLDLFTTSWGVGGFAPELTLFDADGNYYASDSGGSYSQNPDFNSCGSRQVVDFDSVGDPGTCLDAYIKQEVTAGSYQLVLTERGNDYSQGSPGDSQSYSEFGNPTFTGDNWGEEFAGGSFYSPNTSIQMADVWDVTISAETAAPEPSAAILGLSGMILMGLLARRRRKLS